MSSKNAAYIVTVDMGYGHQRAVHPLRDLAARPSGWEDGGSIITANNYAGIPKNDRRFWESGRRFYEIISRLKNFPLIGENIFGLMDHFQKIQSFYPRRDLSRPSQQVKQFYRFIKAGWGAHLIKVLNHKPLPLITSFFVTAFFAEEHGYKEDIFCLCTDSDISRAWCGLDPKKSRIRYLAPNRRVKERLMMYGIKEKNIFITGFPLPKENIGKNLSVLKKSLRERIVMLDPEKRYRQKYRHTLEYYLGDSSKDPRVTRPLTITFAVGGAGAQREIGQELVKNFRPSLEKGSMRLNLVAGSRNDVFRFYESVIKKENFGKRGEKSINIIYGDDKLKYFESFNRALLNTDILWTKPSELSFYTGLGLPIIIAPPVGSQEDFNRAWLLSMGSGFDQENLRYADEWLFDWLRTGWLAEAAMKGFMDAPRNGAYHVEEIVLKGRRSEIEDMHLL